VLFINTASYSQSRELANKYWNKAQKFKEQRRYLEAAEMFEKSAEAERKSHHPRLDWLAAEVGWAGYFFLQVGQFDKALKYYEEALAINRKLGKEDKVAHYFNSIGSVYKEWGQYDKALKYREEALVINRKLGKETALSSNLNNIGFIYRIWGQYDKALKYYEEALSINRKLDRQDHVAKDLNNIGAVYKARRQYSKAIKCLKESLAINRKLDNQNGIAANFNNIGLMYMDRGQYNKAIKHFEEALAILTRLSMKPPGALTLRHIGVAYHKFKKYDEAIKYFKKSVNIIERLRQTATGHVRSDYLASQISSYQWLSSTYVKNNDLNNAFATIELSRAKLLSEKITKLDKISIPTLDQIQKGLSSDMAIIIYANVNWRDKIEIVILKDNIYGLIISDTDLIKAVDIENKASINKLFNNQRGVKIIKKDEQEKNIKQGQIDFDDIINYYRSLLTNPSSQYNRGNTYANTQQKAKPNVDHLGIMLCDFLIKPLEKHIDGKKHLIIIPDGVLGFLPFEALKDTNGNYLVNKYSISYVQSLGVLDLLKKRTYMPNRKPLLAFGGAVYDKIKYSADMIQSEKQLEYLKKKLHSSSNKTRAVRNAYASLDLANWSNLPGTLSEVNNINKVVKNSKILTGKDVTEYQVKQLSKNGDLKNYKAIHFATHGLVVPEIPELSAIVLSQFKDEPNNEDGYLRMGEISELNINADFVNLSACETGLGKIYSGEGVVGFAHSFFIAGANGLSVSLWQVADISTSKFMVAMYGLVTKQDVEYDVAINEIKRRFIRGDFGDTYKAPYYWAPFVYYGKF
jgi:CHAT domain-containing protein/Tfp pilus assembly protein PilF